MKKYLMTGMAALAICAAFTSCSKDTDVYNSGVIENNNKQSIVNSYNEAFVKTFGQPAANHNWGFVNYAKSSTRDVDVNGNMWETRPELGATEEQDVLDYMDMTLAQMTAAGHKYSKLFPVNMPNFFVTQVHTGDDYYGSAQEPTNKNVLGSTHMNELVIAITESAARTNNTIASNTLPEADSWHHVNNFNAGSSKDWGGNTKFVNMGTCDFAYHNSKDSRFHNRWIVVNGADIDAKYAGYYYVCFDFQSQVPDGQTDKTYFSFNGLNDSGTMQSYNGEIEGFYQTAQDIIDAGITEIKGYDGKTRKIEDIEDFTVTRWEHAHAIIPGDNNYSDWIIRLVAATPDNEDPDDPDDPDDPEDPEYTLRVICEDLNAQAGEGDPEDSDWDFNDLVFDVKFLGSNQVQIQVVAVGGTLPIRINGEDALEAHGLYDQGTNIMINTGAGAKYPSQAYESNGIPEKAIFTRTIAGVDDSYGKNIKVEVKKGNDWIELTAEADQPAAKIGVEPTFDYCTERVDISGRYTNFISWIRTKNPVRWWNE